MAVRDKPPLLQMNGIVKNFPGVKALKGVNFDVREGEVHALMGENGAGKSTLMKCLIGIHPQTSGEIIFKGNSLGYYSTADALKLGISMIHQELSPVLHRPVMENIWLGREPRTSFRLVDHKKMADMTYEILKVIELDIDPRIPMKELTVAKMQMVEIAKAISYNASLIIMDEPTSALTENEVVQLFKIIGRLKSEGKGIIYISHKMDEIFKIADRITVLRDGEYVGTDNAADTDMERMITMMVGRSVSDMFPKVKCEIGDTHLEVKGLCNSRFFHDVSFSVRRGEILGIAGLLGSGRTEVIEGIFGIKSLSAGEIFIDGQKADIRKPSDAIANGMAFLTEDRRETGIFPMLDVMFNMFVASMDKHVGKSRMLDTKSLLKICGDHIKAINVKTPSLYQKVENLSGGNQQKVLVARWLMTSPSVLFLDEPTRGIDVGAKAEIHALISKLAGQGKSVVMVSSELPEIIGMSDRIMIMREGRVTGILDNSKKLRQEEIMRYASGVA